MTGRIKTRQNAQVPDLGEFKNPGSPFCAGLEDPIGTLCGGRWAAEIDATIAIIVLTKLGVLQS